ncbi:hypothetical protein [Oceanobacillus piezotolerans]|nr:hypothetical protein [Oceanobacillus piezotolerans]
MRYQQKDFNAKLKENIRNTEIALIDYMKRLLKENKSIFAEKS